MAKKVDRNRLEERLRARLHAIVPPGTVMTPELRAQVEDEVFEEIREELASQNVPTVILEALMKRLLQKREPDEKA